MNIPIMRNHHFIISLFLPTVLPVIVNKVKIYFFGSDWLYVPINID